MMAASYISSHGASWTLLWGVLLGVAAWAIITASFKLGRHRALALVGVLAFFALYSASQHREAEEFKRATPAQKGEAEEYAAENP
jgi:hypothetical protein